MPAVLSTSRPPTLTRRLRRKTTVGNFAVVGASEAEAMPAASTPAQPAWTDTFLEAEDLGAETDQRKQVYLVTLPHPRVARTTGDRSLRAPGDYNRLAVAQMFLDVFASPEALDPAAGARGAQTTLIEEMVVFQELHAADAAGERHVHYHVALRTNMSFRFASRKSALQMRYGLASHWSDSHEGYWSAVRYGYIPTPKKPQAELDSEPLAWGRLAPHRRLFEASQEPVTAEATRRRREASAKKASEQGKPEPRPKEHDLNAVIVEQGFQNTPDDPWAHKRLISYLKKNEPQLWQYAFRMRSRLAALIDDVWEWERVDDELALLGQSRLERLEAAARSPCICQGLWRQHAETVVRDNAVNATELCSDILRSITYGRHENLPVVVLVGKHGGEGKSFLLSPLRRIFGAPYIQETPQPGSFPLLGLETKRIAILDEWEFDNAVIPFSTQLLWFEGKAFPITRPQNKDCTHAREHTYTPTHACIHMRTHMHTHARMRAHTHVCMNVHMSQNKDYSGHILYQGKAPVFIICKEKTVAPIFARAQSAIAQGLPSQDTMLLRRLRTYCLSQPLPIPDGLCIQECPHCFAQMVAWHVSQAR